jgi:hypothetical protein
VGVVVLVQATKSMAISPEKIHFLVMVRSKSARHIPSFKGTHQQRTQLDKKQKIRRAFSCLVH